MKHVASLIAIILGLLAFAIPAHADWSTGYMPGKSIARPYNIPAATDRQWRQSTGHFAKAHGRAAVARSGSGNVHSKAGASAYVSPSYAAAFQALVDDLEAHGAVIKFMGGYRSGGCGQANKHACGMALDICQTGRDVGNFEACHMPGRAAENEIAAAHGLFHGAQWCNPDRGHFEAGGSVMCGAHGWAHVGARQRTAYMKRRHYVSK